MANVDYHYLTPFYELNYFILFCRKVIKWVKSLKR